ncbi:MAG: DnaJ domain-containing protein [Deltaproteobacteria bacterium]|nr:DnaJ domain-containing protein [Deltaproteobacteria bacterium]
MDFVAEIHMIPTLRSGDALQVATNGVEKLLLNAIDGKRDVQQLAEQCGIEQDMVCRMVGRLLQAGVLDVAMGGQNNDRSDVENPVKDDVHLISEPKISREDETPQNLSEDAVTEMYEKLENSNCYEILGVPPIAQRSEIRAAYFALSKKFHPDTHFRQGSDELKKKLSYIFDKLTNAYDTLSGKSKRSAYDESIASEIELWKMEQSIRRSLQPQQQRNDSSANTEDSAHGRPRRGTEAVSVNVSKPEADNSVRYSIPQRVSATSYRRTPVQDKVSVGAGARISRGPVTRSSYLSEPGSAPSFNGAVSVKVERSPLQSQPTSADPPQESEASSKAVERRRQQWKRERLKKVLGVGGGIPATAPDRRTGGDMGSQSEVYLLDHARIAIEKHEFGMAIQFVQEVLRRDGENSNASQLLRQAQSGKVKSDINELVRRGRFEQSSGNVSAALELYERAFKLDIRNVDAKYHVSVALLEMRKDLRRALMLCREIVAMGGRKPQYFETLGLLYEQLHDQERAGEMYRRGLELAPLDRELKKRLKALSK